MVPTNLHNFFDPKTKETPILSCIVLDMFDNPNHFNANACRCYIIIFFYLLQNNCLNLQLLKEVQFNFGACELVPYGCKQDKLFKIAILATIYFSLKNSLKFF
jgi:hypothetical protein